MRFPSLLRRLVPEPKPVRDTPPARTPSGPVHIDVPHGGQVYRVALKRSARARRLSLRVSSVTREATLTVPARARLDAAAAFARSHGGWIAARLAALPQPVAFVDGARIPLRGVEHRIVALGGVRGGVRMATNAVEPSLLVAGDAAFLSRRLTDWLRKEARRDLEAATRSYALRLGVAPRRIAIKDTRSRWGSCAASGVISFSWRLILAPPMVLDYLAAHEVTHLVEMNHGPRFWRALRSACPHVDAAEAWLKRHGRDLHRYGS